jgi:hypothetical protein
MVLPVSVIPRITMNLKTFFKRHLTPMIKPTRDKSGAKIRQFILKLSRNGGRKMPPRTRMMLAKPEIRGIFSLLTN